MITIFRNTFTRSWGTILGWGLSLAALGWYVIAIFDSVTKQQESFMELVKGYPPELMSFFGDATAIFTPNGYLTFTFFSYMPPVLGIFAVIVGGGLLAGDEEKGTLDLVLAHPISRTGFFLGQCLAFVMMLLGILTLGWMGLMFPIGSTGLHVTGVEMAKPFVSLLAVVLFFGALSLMLSQWLPSARASATTAGLVLIGNYFLTSLGRVNDQLKD
jgi:ABC-2 type transport system permease protein